MPSLAVNYYNKDYDAIKANLINEIKSKYKDKWTDFSENDFGMMLLELFCSMADMTSFNMDNQVQETFLETARRRLNVSMRCEDLGHKLQPAKSGMTKVSIVLEEALIENYTVPLYTQFKTGGVEPKIFTSYENFIIESTVGTPRNCMWTIVIESGTQHVSDVALTGVDIISNTDGAVIYAKLKNEAGKNKIALYKNSARTGVLNSDEDDVNKIAYGECPSGIYEVPMTQVYTTGITGKIFIGSSDLPATEDTGEEFHINGPTCFEGEIVQDTFISDGTADQNFDTTYNIQQIPSRETVTLDLQVNASAWTEVEDFFFERGKYFKVKTIFEDSSTIVFGSSDSGQIPVEGATIVVEYVKGNGLEGHVGRGMITGLISVLTHLSQTLRVQNYNIEETTGADDPETIEHAKIAAKEYYSNRARMAADYDYEALIKNYYEESKYNPKIVQAWKDDTEPDLVNELEIYVLSTDEKGKFRFVDIDLTPAGGLWAYIDDIKVIPEGIRKTDGTSGIMDGVVEDTAAKFWYTIYRYTSYDREVIREEVRTAIENCYHSLDFQDSVVVNKIAAVILQIEGVQAVSIYSDAGRSVPAQDVLISGDANKGKVLTLTDDFYTVGAKVYLLFNDEI